MKFISKFWFQEYSHKRVVDFFIQNLSGYRSIAIFDVQEPDYPVAWTTFKAGGMVGLRYTLSPYRKSNLAGAINHCVTWITWLYNIPGIAEVEDDMLALWKLNQKEILGKSFCIWNYPSLIGDSK